MVVTRGIKKPYFIYIYIYTHTHTLLMINNLFIFGVQLINLFNYSSLTLNLKQLNTA